MHSSREESLDSHCPRFTSRSMSRSRSRSMSRSRKRLTSLGMPSNRNQVTMFRVFPRIIPDASRCFQMLPRCRQIFPDASQMLPDVSRCLPDAEQIYKYTDIHMYRCLLTGCSPPVIIKKQPFGVLRLGHFEFPRHSFYNNQTVSWRSF